MGHAYSVLQQNQKQQQQQQQQTVIASWRIWKLTEGVHCSAG
jgi:hypothetical protein